MDLSRLLPGLGPDRPTRRFIAYDRLLDACEKPGCPVCHCLREVAVQSLDALLYEQVTDPTTRAGLGLSWGFCAWHATMARTVRSAGLGVAIIYETLVKEARARLADAQRERTRGPAEGRWRHFLRRGFPFSLLRARAERRPCPLCVALERMEVGYLRSVLDAIATPEFEQAYDRSVGLCLPHLTRTLATFPDHRGVDALLTRVIEKLDRQADGLRRFVEKHDYRRQAPFTEEEGVAWTTALGFFGGEPGVFGNEMHRPLAPAAPMAPPDAAEPVSAENEGAESLRRELERLSAEKARLEARLRAVSQQLGDESSRAAGLHYRLFMTTEDRKILEMNLAGERATAQTWERMARELQAENERLKGRLAQFEPPPVDVA